MNDQKAHIQEVVQRLTADPKKLRRYSIIAFVMIVIFAYGFLLFRVSVISNQQPSETEISGYVNASQVPQIDMAVVKQLQSLEDNSVNVQALFNQARSNPFQ